MYKDAVMHGLTTTLKSDLVVEQTMFVALSLLRCLRHGQSLPPLASGLTVWVSARAHDAEISRGLGHGRTHGVRAFLAAEAAQQGA